MVTHEVFPALGCTEPIAVAYAAALAAAQLKGEVEEVRIEVDPGVFKNGFAVTVPNAGGEKGNLILLSHLVNGYIKCYTGDLSPICGCAIAAGVGAAVAIVYQRSGKDLEKINLAVNTLVSDLGGMLCDGAKAGCALKVVSSTESAIRAAYMALKGHGITEEEGFVGRSAEETIRNISRIGEIGMSLVDETMLEIMGDKRSRLRPGRNPGKSGKDPVSPPG